MIHNENDELTKVAQNKFILIIIISTIIIMITTTTIMYFLQMVITELIHVVVIIRIPNMIVKTRAETSYCIIEAH